MFRDALSPCRILSLTPQFDVADGALRQTWRAEIANLSGRPRDVVARAMALGAAAEERVMHLQPGQIAEAEWTFDATDLNFSRFGAHLSVQCEGEQVDQLTAVADALEALRAAARWLMAGQRPDGPYSNYYYADVYGARSLFALARNTGDKACLDSAWRVGDHLVDAQLDNGGWWVGYGTPNECVFVADNGSIALNLVQMAAYAESPRRERTAAALLRHVPYRESFRITDAVAKQLEAQYGKEHRGIVRGGLGIGYVRTDYFTRERFPAQHREARQQVWTMHCSSGFLPGLHRLTGDAAVGKIAVRDARWLVESCARGDGSVRSPYASEAAVWMLDQIDDPALHAEFESLLRGDFRARVTEQDENWWRRSDGRGALLLPGLVTYMRNLENGPEIRAALARALWSIASETSPLSLQAVTDYAASERRCHNVMYVCFSATGLAELLWPRSTLMPRAAGPAGQP